VIVQPTLKAIDLDDMTAPYRTHKSSNKIKAPIIIGELFDELFVVISKHIKKEKKKERLKRSFFISTTQVIVRR
jgi:hypothetical protein